jgi:hypothetical protein
MSEANIKAIVWQVASEFAGNGPGWAQEGVVLREVGERVFGGNGGHPDLSIQQMILNYWHDLFSEKKLAWGFDLDNPNSPFFHIRNS